MYTIKDVIIDRYNSDIKKSIGKECFVGRNPYECLNYANNNQHIHRLRSIDSSSNMPFIIYSNLGNFTNSYPCIILKK